jgi:uncharacterized membrane protein
LHNNYKVADNSPKGAFKEDLVMDTAEQIINFLARWGHGLFGITWIGMLYYFNFIQGAYFKEASPEGLADAKAKLAPRALWWFRWGAMFTFLTGLILIHFWYPSIINNDFIILGIVLGTLMAANVWMVIWPAQKVALGIVDGGDKAAAAAKALLASRTNTLFSAPMLFGMFASGHYPVSVEYGGLGLYLGLAIILLLELNGLKGKMGLITSVRGVIVSSLVLTGVLACLIHLL